MKTWWKVLLSIVGIILILVLCGGIAYIGFWFGGHEVEVVEKDQAPAICTQVPTCPVLVPVVIDFGPEHAFPSKVEGPAIAELWNPNTGFCGLVKVNQGESFSWDYSGAWWQAANQDVLNVRFPHHTAEYLAKSSNASCKVLLSAKDVPQP